MQIDNRLNAFSVLGNNLESFIHKYHQNKAEATEEELYQIMQSAHRKNAWFTIENQLYALEEWAKALQKENLEKWISSYKIQEKEATIGLILAGNIPMVGFHDILTVVMSGSKAKVKLSSKDDVLIPYLINKVNEIEPKLKESVEFVERLTDYDAVIATGSDNTARYFETYFSSVPHLIRKNRTSVAILNGKESEEERKGLARDIFQYFGLGCRNVTRLFVPKGYDLDLLFGAFYDWKEVINHHKYANNYDYYKAIYLMKKDPVIENGFLLVKKDQGLFSPIATLFYDEYESEEVLRKEIEVQKEKIQCVVSSQKGDIAFGQTQSPRLWDYADGVDTMQWILDHI